MEYNNLHEEEKNAQGSSWNQKLTDACQFPLFVASHESNICKQTQAHTHTHKNTYVNFSFKRSSFQFCN